MADMQFNDVVKNATREMKIDFIHKFLTTSDGKKFTIKMLRNANDEAINAA